jgi:hypothetical protein
MSPDRAHEEESMTEQTQSQVGYGAFTAEDADPQRDDASMDASMTDKATESAQAGRDAAGEVAQTAAGQAKQVAAQAQSQTRNLVGEARDQLRSQAGDQQRHAVTNLRSLGQELGSMAGNSQQSGLAADLVRQAADRTHGVADWLDGRQPEDLLEELRRFARRRPGAFLLGALAVGVVAGRLTRGAVAAHSQDSASDTAGSLPGPADSTGYAGPAGQDDRSNGNAQLPYGSEAGGQSYGGAAAGGAGTVYPTPGAGAV